ncbi:MAG: RloB family protein [Lentimicrobiaceae bacterium]|jgi:hypothetical protein
MAKRRQNFRHLISGVVILGEGITEKYYFEHLKNIKGYTCIIRPRFFCNTCIDEMQNRIIEALQGDVTVICVFDADVASRNEPENRKLTALRNKYERNKNVIFCDSLPTIEYWFLLHYRDTCPNYPNSAVVVRDLKRHIPAFAKNEDFLEKEKWVRDMSITNGSLLQAMERAEKYNHREASYSDIYLAINKLNETIG